MTKTLGKSVLFKCGRCVGLITISEPSFLVIYEGHFYCLRCRKAGGYKCASQHEERARRIEETLAGTSQYFPSATTRQNPAEMAPRVGPIATVWRWEGDRWCPRAFSHKSATSR